MQVPDFVKQDIPLAKYSTLGVGGRAGYFVAIDSPDKLIDAYDFARENQLDILFLGRGSNILFSDRGFRGLVMHMNLRGLHYHHATNELWADAGTLVSEIVSLGEDLGFTGFEPFAGLPGTIGGAIYGNAGCYGKQFWDVIEKVKYFNGNNFQQMSVKPGSHFYRRSIFKDFPDRVIVAAKLKFKPSDSKTVIAETKRIRKLRYENQPTQASVGCIFKNPEVSGKVVSAGWLIDKKAGLKGTQVGGAMISRKHANFFVNLCGAKASDFIELIKIAKGRVFENSGILLEEEICMVGEF